MLETGGPYVVFPPTDEAFADLPKNQLDALMADPKVLADVLRYHIVEGFYPRGHWAVRIDNLRSSQTCWTWNSRFSPAR
jgi:uncharacterized surface protein with fasciclin (FAS1) repeats